MKPKVGDLVRFERKHVAGPLFGTIISINEENLKYEEMHNLTASVGVYEILSPDDGIFWSMSRYFEVVCETQSR